MLRQTLAFGRWCASKAFGLFGNKADDVAKAAAATGDDVAARTARELSALRAAGNLTDDHLAAGLRSVAGATASAGGEAVRRFSSRIGTVVKWGIVGAVGEALLNGRQGIVGGALNSAWTEAGKVEAEQNTLSRWHGFYKNIQELLRMFGIEGTMINRWVDARVSSTQGNTPSTFQNIRDAVPNVDLATAGYAAAGVAGVTGLAAAAPRVINALGGSGGTSGGPTGGAPTSGASTPSTPSAAAGAADDVARGAARATSGWRSVLGRLPVVGKYFGAAALVGAGAMALSGEAEAAPVAPTAPTAGGATPPAATPQTYSLGPVTLSQETVAEVGGLGASVALGGAFTRAAAAGATTVAPAIGLGGLRLVPGLGAVVVGGETTYQVGRDLLNGNFRQAALNLGGGAIETVGAIGGFATLGIGAIAREGYSALASRATGLEVSGSLTGGTLRAAFEFGQEAGVIPRAEETPEARAEAAAQPQTLGDITPPAAPTSIPLLAGNGGAFAAAANNDNAAQPAAPSAPRQGGLVDRLAARRQAAGMGVNGAMYIPDRAAAGPQMQ